MARTYTKQKRAEKEAETRDRIVEATLALHGEVGVARTTISMIAERAGVQRHTVYAHFPDERALLMACSGLHMERDPLPTPEAWQATNDPEQRVRQALNALYTWFAQNETIAAAFHRDAEQHALLREINELRLGPGLRAFHASLSEGLGANGKAALLLAMSFYTWRTLARDAGLEPAAVVDLMARAVLGADGTGVPRAGEAGLDMRA
jgi:AcrR family transcriptional regulator